MLMMLICLFSGAARKFPPVLQYMGDMWLHALVLSLLVLSILLERSLKEKRAVLFLHHKMVKQSVARNTANSELVVNDLVMQEKVVCNSMEFWLTLHSCTTLSWEQVASRLWSLFQKQLVTCTGRENQTGIKQNLRFGSSCVSLPAFVPPFKVQSYWFL